MKENRLIPKRRFKEFENDGAWELCRLGEVVDFLDEQRKPLEAGMRVSGPYPYYGASGIIDYVEDYLFDEELVLLSEDGANIIDRNYRVCFLASGKYWVNNHAHVLRSKENYNNSFICESLECINYDKYNTGTAQPKLNQKVCRNISIKIPHIDEQIKIAGFMQQLDKLITLHQRKLKKMKDLKSAYLSEMFPKEGEKYPKRRFAGFTDSWGKRKLGDVAPLRGGSAFQSSRYCNGGIPIVRISNILSDGTVGGEFARYIQQEDDSSFVLKNGDILLAMSGATTGKVSILRCRNTDKYYQNQRVGVFKRNHEVDYSYVSTLVRSELFFKQLKNVLVAGAQPNVSSKDIDFFEFMFPKNREEQTKIGKLFDNIDNLITLHQHKLEKLQNLKKAYLNEMFV